MRRNGSATTVVEGDEGWRGIKFVNGSARNNSIRIDINRQATYSEPHVLFPHLILHQDVLEITSAKHDTHQRHNDGNQALDYDLKFTELVSQTIHSITDNRRSSRLYLYWQS
jgi:hypothetical protein